MNYEEMSDHEINMAVTCIDNGCQGWSVTASNTGFYHCGVDGSGFYEIECVNYCNNPSDAWGIIVENKIALDFIDGFGWTANPAFNSAIEYSCHSEPLRAAMICFLKMNDAEK